MSNIGLYKGVSKKTGKTIKGNLLKVGRRYYIVKFKSLTRYMRADYLWFDGGSDKYEVEKDSIEGLFVNN